MNRFNEASVVMVSNAGRQPQFMRLTYSFAKACLLVLLLVIAGHAQDKPMTKENLVSAIEMGSRPPRKDVKSFIKLIEDNGVDFRILPEDDTQITQAGKYLGTRALEELIRSIEHNYRPYKGERLRIFLFNYVPCEKYQADFAELLGSKVKKLPGVFTDGKNQYSYIKGLKLEPTGRPSLTSVDEQERYWETNRSLQLLEGTCSPEDKIMISHVFLGSLGGPLRSPVLLKFKIDPKEFGDTRDLHSLLILYSLAREAQERRLGREIVLKYLEVASGIAEDIKHPEHSDMLQPIKDAIEDMRRKLGATNLVALPAPKPR